MPSDETPETASNPANGTIGKVRDATRSLQMGVVAVFVARAGLLAMIPKMGVRVTHGAQAPPTPPA